MPKPLDEKQLPRVRELFMLMAKLPLSKQTFARSLQDGFRTYGRLTPNQMEWVEKLIVMANAPPMAAANEDAHKYGQKIPGFKCVEDLLIHASEHQQFPCIRLRTEKGRKITLRPISRDGGVKVQAGEYSGRVVNEVIDLKYLRYHADVADILNLLSEMAAHPQETAIRYGKKYKSCCFCGISLTDPRSLLMGYGPICADNYGLPWGDPQTDQQAQVEELEQMWRATNT